MKALFICGCERSGTTMLASMLGKAPGAVVIPEAQFLVKMLYRFEDGLHSGHDFRTFLASSRRFQIWGISPSVIAGNQLNLREFMEQVVLAYCSKENEEIMFWIDHTPANVCYIYRLKKLFPEAKFIHLIRDGRGVAASIKSLPDWPFYSMEGIAQHWKNRIVCGLAAERCFPKDVLGVRYEDLVAHPGKELQNICKFTGLVFNIDMLKGDEFRIPRYTKNQHKLVSTRPCAQRAYAWREDLDNRLVSIFETETADLLPLLGYKLEGTIDIKVTRIKRLKAELLDTIVAGISRVKRYFRWLKSQEKMEK